MFKGTSIIEVNSGNLVGGLLMHCMMIICLFVVMVQGKIPCMVGIGSVMEAANIASVAESL